MRKTLLFSLAALLIVAMAIGGEETDPRKAPAGAGNNELFGTNTGWLPLTQITTASYQFPSVQYLDTVAWIAGYKTAAPRLPLAYYSIKGGDWVKVTLPAADRGMFRAWDAKNALYATFGGKVFRTTNAGTSWDSVYYYGAGAGFFDGVMYITKDTAIAFGDADASGLLVIRSTDGGATWTRITNLPAEDKTADKYAAYATLGQAMDVYGRTVWLTSYETAGTPARILKSTDAGDTWNSWAPALTGGATPNYYIRSINMLNDSVGYIIDRSPDNVNFGYIHKTTDGGTTWGDTVKVDAASPHATQELRSAKPLRGTNVVVVVGNNFTANKGIAWWSTNSGSTWTSVPPVGAELYNTAFKDVSIGLGVGFTNALKFTVGSVRMVVFKLNTATVPDTIPVAGSTIQVRGGTSNAGGFSPITWGNDAQNAMTRIGGDYWTKTVYMQAGDTLRYKYVVAYSSGTGWEQGVVPADVLTGDPNRSLIVPDRDTTLQVEFWNNGAGTRPQYFRPWTTAPDSFLNVYFRVNMRGRISQGGFNPLLDTVAVRGGGNPGDDLDWGRSTFLTAESGASAGDGYTIAASDMYSARLRFRKSAVTAGTSIGYKFLFNNSWDGREESANRSFTIPIGLKDTTLSWVFYNNERPAARANPDTIKITFITNLAQAAASGGVNVLTDTVYVRTGYFTTAAEAGRGKRLARVSGTIFQAVDTIVTAKKKLLDYQYYVVKNGVEVRENYYNFFFTGSVLSEAERRQILIDSTASVASGQTVRDTATSVALARRQPDFPNGRLLARNVNVKWTCDLRPAYYQVNPAWGGDTLSDIQGTLHVFPSQKDSVMNWGVWINGPATGGWATWGNTASTDLGKLTTQKMYDNGSNGDKVTGDSIFTRQILASPDSLTSGDKYHVGQIYKFGIRGGDNEGGRGGFGNNHKANIVDTDSIFTIATDFGSINPAFYDAWNYDLHKPQKPTSVFEPGKPLAYELAQNYPNPFNPTTKIEYSIPAVAKVELKIYNVVGQEVATLVNEIQVAGVHHVKFDGMNLASGMYFYRLTAGDFVSVKKMVLLK